MCVLFAFDWDCKMKINKGKEYGLILCLLCVLADIYAQEIVEIPLIRAAARGPCCAECPGGSQHCIEQFLQGMLTDPCTVTICTRLATEIIDGDSETGLDLNTFSVNDSLSSIDLELGSVRS